MAELARLSHTHEMLICWLLVNPDKSLRECADHFGYTQSWLSSIIHSDLFQAELSSRQQGIAAKVADSIPEKLRRAGDIAIEKLTTALEGTEDPEFILDATDKILHRMGYAPQSSRNPGGSPGSVNQQNNFFLSAGDIAEARALIGQSQALTPAERGVGTGTVASQPLEGQVLSRAHD